MLPADLLTVMTPSATVQPAGDLSAVETHCRGCLPSNRTIASEGGGASRSAGRDHLGTGSQTSVSFGLGFAVWAAPGAGCLRRALRRGGWANAGSATALSIVTIRMRERCRSHDPDCGCLDGPCQETG